MPDPYLYPDVPVLQNKLEIKTEKLWIWLNRNYPAQT